MEFTILLFTFFGTAALLILGLRLMKATAPPKVITPETIARRRISATDLLNGDENAHKRLLLYMRQQRFAAIDMDFEQASWVQALRTASEEFFAKDNGAKAEQLAPMKESDIPELNRRPNHGWVLVEGMKEYLKLCRDEKQVAFPNTPMSGNYEMIHQRAFDFFHELTMSCLRSMGTYEEDGRTAFEAGTVQKLAPFIQDKSSISIINYFARDTEGDPSGEHVDTGLLTLILCSDTPGLQVWDEQRGRYVEVEKAVPRKMTLFLIQGRKVDVLCGRRSLFPPTRHRVHLPPHTQRISILYFQDVP